MKLQKPLKNEEAIEGKVGDTLNNGYYEVTLTEVTRAEFAYIEVKNIGNDKVTYISEANFRVEYDDSSVSWGIETTTHVPGENSIILDVGQIAKFKIDVRDSTKLIFQAYTDAAVMIFDEDVYSFPLGQRIGKPIAFLL